MKCFDKRVLIGLGVVAVGVLLFNPGWIGAVLPLLLVLACPLSMVFMMRAMGGRANASCSNDEQQAADGDRTNERPRPTEVAELRKAVARLRAQLGESQRRVDRGPGERAAPVLPDNAMPN